MSEVADAVNPPEGLTAAGLAMLFTKGATANRFSPEPVGDDVLRSIWELAKWPPTSANFQPLRVLFVQSAAALATLGEAMLENNRAKTLAAPAVAVLALDRSWHEHIATTTPHLSHLTEHFAANEDQRLETARNNSWLQAGYFILAVRARGLAAGPMLGFDSGSIDAAFFPDGRRQTFLVVNIGYPTEGSYRARLPRLGEDQTVSFA